MCRYNEEAGPITALERAPRSVPLYGSYSGIISHANSAANDLLGLVVDQSMVTVGQCSLTVSKPVLNRPMVSALQNFDIINCFQHLLPIKTCAATSWLRTMSSARTVPTSHAIPTVGTDG